MLVIDRLTPDERKLLATLTEGRDTTAHRLAELLVPPDTRAFDGFTYGVEGLEEVHMHGDAAWCAALLAQVLPADRKRIARQIVGGVTLAVYLIHDRAFRELPLDDDGCIALFDQAAELRDAEQEIGRLAGEFEGAKATAELVAAMFAEHRHAARTIVNKVQLAEDPAIVHVVHTGGVVHGAYADPLLAAAVAGEEDGVVRSCTVYIPSVLVVDDAPDPQVGEPLPEPEEP